MTQSHRTAMTAILPVECGLEIASHAEKNCS